MYIRPGQLTGFYGMILDYKEFLTTMIFDYNDLTEST